MLYPAAYSASVALSQVISTKIPLSVVDTSVIRTAAVGIGCMLYLCSGSIATPTPGVVALSVLSGIIMFAAAAAYITMCRCYGVVSTGLMTTAFSFLFSTMGGAYLGETVPLKTYAAMLTVMVGMLIASA